MIADVAWVCSQRGLPTLELSLDGHPAHFRSRQRTELLRKGLLDGITFLASERTTQVPGAFIHGDYRPEFDGLDLVGCTDDPDVFALYQEMCDAIRTNRWKVGLRPLPALAVSR
jgi:hypothetical protein